MQIVIVIKAVFKIKEEEGGCGINLIMIDPSNKEDQNLVHLLLLIPIPNVFTLMTCHHLPALAIASLFLTRCVPKPESLTLMMIFIWYATPIPLPFLYPPLSSSLHS